MSYQDIVTISNNEFFKLNDSIFGDVDFNGRGTIFPTNYLYNPKSYVPCGNSYLLLTNMDGCYIFFDSFLDKNCVITFDKVKNEIKIIRLCSLLSFYVPRTWLYGIWDDDKFVKKERTIEIIPLLDKIFPYIMFNDRFSISRSSTKLLLNLKKDSNTLYKIVHNGMDLNNFILYRLLKRYIYNFVKNKQNVVKSLNSLNELNKLKREYINGEIYDYQTFRFNI